MGYHDLLVFDALNRSCLNWSLEGLRFGMCIPYWWCSVAVWGPAVLESLPLFWNEHCGYGSQKVTTQQQPTTPKLFCKIIIPLQVIRNLLGGVRSRWRWPKKEGTPKGDLKVRSRWEAAWWFQGQGSRWMERNRPKIDLLLASQPLSLMCAMQCRERHPTKSLGAQPGSG